MKFPRWVFPAAAALTASGMVVTACGQDTGTKENAAGAQGQVAPVPGPSSSPSPAPAPEPTTLEVARNAKLGQVVTDADGRTLYRFDNDTARPSASTCAEACAKAWPPVWAGPAETGVEGVEQALVGKVKRPDGRWQVTLAGWPLYRYAKDDGPGDVEGQGVGGNWFAATPAGKKAGPAENNRLRGWTVIKATNDPDLGLILTDGEGRTLYRFDEDDDKPPTTTCFGDCKKAWPPAVFKGWKKLRLEGVSKKAVDFIEREDDGKCQLTINGWPMYYYEKDERPGDANGQGVGGVWWATDPKGKRATSVSASPGGGNGGNASGGGY